VVALTVGISLLTLAAARRDLGAFEIGATATAIFLLSNKVYSPGYDLWLVPFFAALPIMRRWWVTFCAADFGVYFVVFGNSRLGLPGELVKVFLCCFVLVRAAAIVTMIASLVRRRLWRTSPHTTAAPAPAARRAP